MDDPNRDDQTPFSTLAPVLAELEAQYGPLELERYDGTPGTYPSLEAVPGLTGYTPAQLRADLDAYRAAWAAILEREDDGDGDGEKPDHDEELPLPTHALAVVMTLVSEGQDPNHDLWDGHPDANEELALRVREWAGLTREEVSTYWSDERGG